MSHSPGPGTGRGVVTRPTLGVTARFALVLLVILPSFVMLALSGREGLSSTRHLTDTLITDIIATEHASATMVVAMDQVHLATLSALAQRSSDPARFRTLSAALSNELIPAVDADLAAVVQLHARDGAAEKRTIAELTARWHDVRALWNSMVTNPPTETVGVAKIDAAFVDLTRVTNGLVAREVRDGNAEYSDSHHLYTSERDEVLLLLFLAVGTSLAAVILLYRSVLPRARRYAAFAEGIASGEVSSDLEIHGRDELATLGKSLDEMATNRRRERLYDGSQLDFAESMQLTENEAEAHRMLKRHLERSIDGAEVVILNRNNSQDRLEAVTNVAPGSPLEQSLDSAVPRSCIAVRQARTYEHDEGEDPLLRCSVCADCPGRTTCTPFLVGGEVIGSVLLNREQRLDGEHTRRIRDSVVQAAPVLANLRNLAIAETRAATDSLTGLPNRRSIDANLMRMVAHAGRSMEPMALLMLDLDHFKRVNDRYGHGGGDEVLAAVGATIRASIRDSDFAGRYGGEEFIVAVPKTTTEGAVHLAELLRRAIASIVVPSVDQPTTISIGVAVLPEHAGDASGLVRAADRALYLAKNNGRDRIETAHANAFEDTGEEHRGSERETAV